MSIDRHSIDEEIEEKEDVPFSEAFHYLINQGYTAEQALQHIQNRSREDVIAGYEKIIEECKKLKDSTESLSIKRSCAKIIRECEIEIRWVKSLLYK